MVRPRTFAAAVAAALCSAIACLAAGASAALGASPDPSPFAIEDGEPWIAYSGSMTDAGGTTRTASTLVRPDGRDQHLLLSTPAMATRTGRPMARASPSNGA